MNEWVETPYGRIPATWGETTLGNICELLTDGSHFSPKEVPSNHRMASVKDMRYNCFDFSSCKTISSEDFKMLKSGNCGPIYGDILLSKDGANCLDLIFVYRQPEDIVLLSSIAIARLKDGYDPDFYRYFLLSPNAQHVMRTNFVSGSAIPRVVLKDFRNVPVPVPTLTDQNRIAEILTSFDDKIDLLRKQNQTLEQIAETLYRQWFQQGTENTWESGFVSDLFVLQRGFDLPTQDRLPGYVPIIASSGIGGYHNVSKVSGPGVTTGRSGVLGNVYYVSDDFWPLNTSLYISEFRRATPLFAYFFLRDLGLFGLNSGSAVPTLNRNHVHALRTTLPPRDLINHFEEKVSVFFAKLEGNKRQIETLEQTRDTLLAKLMSGEVRISSNKENLVSA
jgi:type I restriction enzyme S subunit